MRVSSNHPLRDRKYVQLANGSRLISALQHMADMQSANASCKTAEFLPLYRSIHGWIGNFLLGLLTAQGLDLFQHEVTEGRDPARGAQLFGEGEKHRHFA
ncbi:hypothetical protein SAMN02746000_02246 [Paracoccus sp. J56]|nr:hypothetical protein SAMN02746000_02246 [Paracoccus sp. J56]